MWLVTGPFDGEQGNVTTTKTKLLRSGRKYPLGRKDRELLVNNKKISKLHCEFTVGPYTEDDMENPSFIPRLEIFNAKEKPMPVDRSGEPFMVQPSSSCELKNGDKVNIVAGVTLEVEWRCVACFLPPARNLPSISRENCASMGISLWMTSHPLVTHHITSKYELTVPLATSLLSAAQLVKVEWLQEYIRLGSTSDEANPFKLTKIEQTFVPPPENKYRPAFSPTLPSLLKSFKYWEPSEERLHFLKEYRFVLLANKDGELDSDTRELALRGGAEYDGFCMTSSHAKWRQMLAKAKRKREEVGVNVVAISNEKIIQMTVGSDKWQEMVVDAQTMSVPVIDVETLLHAVISIDLSIIHRTPPSQTRDSSPLPDFVPNTHPKEPSPPAASIPRKETMGIDNGTAPPFPVEPKDAISELPSPPPPEVPAPPPRKKLIRRLKPLSNTGDQSQPNAASSSRPLVNSASAVRPAPLATRPKLKRRAATPVTATVVDSTLVKDEGTQEPPHKKFKALFEASDPDKMVVDTPNSVSAAYDNIIDTSVGAAQNTGSATQNGSHQEHEVVPQRLDTVAEEEEESARPGSLLRESAPPPNQLAVNQPTQRTTPTLQEPRDPSATGSAGEDQTDDAKGQRVPRTVKASGPKQVDTDQVFLTAVASRKRGKKGEDDFDREFNKLRISKPEIHREQEEDWAVLGDFDDDIRNIRGNFMVVVDMDIHRLSHPRGTATLSIAYDGKPNYKKFKKTPTLSSRAPVELVIKTEDDYGVGSGYWKDNTAPKDYTRLPPSNPETQRRRARTVFESDDDDKESNDILVTQKTKKAPQREPKAKTTAPLFLDSDEESIQDKGSQQRVTRQTMQVDDDSAGAPARNKRRFIIADDDSDEDAAFKGFGKKRRFR